jgi:hypothetical protein
MSAWATVETRGLKDVVSSSLERFKQAFEC